MGILLGVCCFSLEIEVPASLLVAARLPTPPGEEVFTIRPAAVEVGVSRACSNPATDQVWPLTLFLVWSFFLFFPFFVKNHCLANLKYFFLPFLPGTPSSLSWTLEGLFGMTLRPSKSSSRAVLPELQRNNTLTGVLR